MSGVQVPASGQCHVGLLNMATVIIVLKYRVNQCTNTANLSVFTYFWKSLVLVPLMFHHISFFGLQCPNSSGRVHLSTPHAWRMLIAAVVIQLLSKLDWLRSCAQFLLMTDYFLFLSVLLLKGFCISNIK